MNNDAVYFNILAKNNDGRIIPIIMNVHEDLADTYISREKLNGPYKDMYIYKQMVKKEDK